MLGDLVDYEQCEGQIARYRCLIVRRSLAREHILLIAAELSPFGKLISLARKLPNRAGALMAPGGRSISVTCLGRGRDD